MKIASQQRRVSGPLQDVRQACREHLAIYRRCSLGLLSFTRLETSDYNVRVLDISSKGMGIESYQEIEPGLVWFYGTFVDQRGGLLVWSRKEERIYRAGIRFLPFTPEDERILRHWPPCAGPLRPCDDLEEHITSLMRSLPGDVRPAVRRLSG